MQKAKKATGASATFLGMQFLRDNNVRVIACGDTNLFVINDKGSIIQSFPYSDIELLNENSHFINTVQLTEQKVEPSYFQVKTLTFSKNATYIMATDALSRLFLINAETIKEVVKIKNFEMLHCFCLKYWDKKELEEDDISAIIIRNDGNNKVEQLIPPDGFSFPKEKEVEFTPATLINNPTEQNFTAMQMQEIYNQFSGVAHDFCEVKRKLRIMEILLIVLIALSLLNLGCFAFTRLVNKGKKTQPQTEQVDKNPLIEKLESIIIQSSNENKEQGADALNSTHHHKENK